jgi:hypothetical protein
MHFHTILEECETMQPLNWVAGGNRKVGDVKKSIVLNHKLFDSQPWIGCLVGAKFHGRLSSTASPYGVLDG